MTTTPVTVTLPLAEPAVIARPEGDPDGMDLLAATLLEASGRYDEFSDEAGQLRLDGAWRGGSQQTYAQRTRMVSEQAERMGDTAKRVGRVILACADRLRHHLRTHEELVARKARLDERLERLTSAISSATAVTPEQATAWQGSADDLAVDYKVLVHDERELRRGVADNEDLLQQALDNAITRDDVLSEVGGRPDLAVRAMEKAGSPRSGAAPAAVREWWQGLSAEEKRAVSASYAHLIANSDGIPPEVRERADRTRDEEITMRLSAKTADGTVTPKEAKRLARIRREAEED
ncbi:hypothetical protein [Nocardioides houyundeii]|uniref:hypothetical protein n=1 Tax=Nocardioides houyundeii TaxID=2045452 RepID=UPI000C7678D1|nr:hypothetical protein [Nocardioides houyundeii]